MHVPRRIQSLVTPATAIMLSDLEPERKVSGGTSFHRDGFVGAGKVKTHP